MHHFVLYDNRGFWSHNFHVAHHAQWIGEKLLRSKKCTSSTQFGVQRISCETRASSSYPFFRNKCMGHWPTGGVLKGAFFVVIVDKKKSGLRLLLRPLKLFNGLQFNFSLREN